MSDEKWIARELQGGIYCAPRCGCGCTKAAFDRATSEAAALAALMGEGWEPEIWENCGWHYAVKKGVATIHADRRGGSTHSDWTIEGYTVFINSARQVVASAKTPEDALGFAIQDARTTERRLANDLADIGAAL